MYTLPIGSKVTSPTTTYTITGVLGQGGFGITYSATCPVSIGLMKAKANVALKEHFVKADCVRDNDTSSVSCSDPARSRVELTRKDFIGEARRLNSISGKNPNIVTVNEVFEANNTAYYAMEMIEGVSLRDYVASHGKLSEDETLSIMTPIVEAVAFLHRNRITHLDIKPQNIMIASDDAGHLRPVLIDFGLSKHYDESGEATSTINSRGFSDGYAPIEQYTGITTFSPSSDVYSLAATMVFCLTGQRLPAALEVTPEVLEKALPASLSPALRSTLMRALQLQPTKRHPDASALLSALSADDTHHEHRAKSQSNEATIVDTPTVKPTKAKPAESRIKNDEAKAKEASKPLKKSAKGLKIAIIAVAALAIGGAAAYFITKPSSEEIEQPTAQVASLVNTEDGASTAAESDQQDQVNDLSASLPTSTDDVTASSSAPTTTDQKEEQPKVKTEDTSASSSNTSPSTPTAEQPKPQEKPTPKFDNARTYFSEGLAAVKKDGKWGYINKSEEIVIPLIYDNAGAFSEGLAAVKKDGKYGFINKSGDVVIPFLYGGCFPFRNGTAAVSIGGKHGHINTSGDIVIPLSYDHADPFFDGMAKVKKGGKYGYVDKSGKVSVPIIYDDGRQFVDGLVPVRKGGKWGYVNKSGKVVIPLIYDDAWVFSGGTAHVEKGGATFLIDKAGNRVN
ncbi:MAG: WG repeat-containing protein [Muribaculaceae bacterium]|nr:WG repeat-containing protein [Muribaculaceae bacterium]